MFWHVWETRKDNCERSRNKAILQAQNYLGTLFGWSPGIAGLHCILSVQANFYSFLANNIECTSVLLVIHKNKSQWNWLKSEYKVDWFWDGYAARWEGKPSWRVGTQRGIGILYFKMKINKHVYLNNFIHFFNYHMKSTKKMKLKKRVLSKWTKK